MKLTLAHPASVPASASPFRLLDAQGQEIAWANAFLDAQRVRQLSLRSLRAYGYDLLHFARWWQDPSRSVSAITESTLLDYVRHQLDQQPPPTPQAVNHRLTVVHCLYRFHCGCEIPAGQSHFQRTYPTRSPLGYGRPRRAVALGLRLKQPRRVIVPLTADEVAKFWRSFRTFRDLALVGLMLLDGLRSCEILALQLEDLQLADVQLRVLGKGNRQRVLPLSGEIINALQSYLDLERPLTDSPYLFLSLKGRQRGRPMTVAGLRSLFRHHRSRSQVPHANPHRFRHTFGADMVRAGISLPALQRLMGHSQIHTTMLYIQLAPQDVWREYARALGNRGPAPLPRSLEADPMSHPQPTLEQLLAAHLQTLALTLRPGSAAGYRYTGPPLSPLSRGRFPAGAPARATPPRSPSARLVRSAVRTKSPDAQPNPHLLPGAPAPPAG